MPKDEWRKERDRDHEKRAKAEIAEGQLRSYEFVWTDSLSSTSAQSSEDLVNFLVGHLRLPSRSLQLKALKVLAEMNRDVSKAIPVITELAKTAKSYKVRCAASEALRTIGRRRKS